MHRHKLAAALVLAACRSAGECDGPDQCGDGEVCVFLDAHADAGACVVPEAGPGVPGDIGPFPVSVQFADRLDVLFVVDDGPAMAARQGALAGAMTDFADALLDARPDLSLRVAVTTTSTSNPACAPGEAGALAFTSCRARLDEFVAEVDGAEIDARAACTDACPHPTLELRASATSSGASVVRPWLEREPTGGNLPPDVDLAAALRCAVPQGVAGCRFTAPLAALEAALAAADEAGPDGFLRPDAGLLIAVVSAGHDCSLQPAHADIFVDVDTFWGPDAPPDLTPAVCWRAGVRCEGPGPAYPSCEPADLGADGQPVAPDDAVLVSPRRVVDTLERLAEDRGWLGARVGLLAVTGVPTDPDAAVSYADAEDPAFQRTYGIGPACASAELQAPPPVRLAAAAAGLSAVEATLGSICEPDLGDSFTAAAAAATAALPPTCFPRCAADLDPATPTLEPSCEFVRVGVIDGTLETVPVCVREGDAWVPPFSAPRCVVLRSDDELDPRCREFGANLEFALVNREPVAPGSVFYPQCRLSDDRSRDCPLL